MVLRAVQCGVGCGTATFDQQGRRQALDEAAGSRGGSPTSGHVARWSLQRAGLDEPQSAVWPAGAFRSATGCSEQTLGQAL